MAKRIADKELTDRNWDQEEEGEEAGTFLVASEDVLKSRPIKKAKRRNIGEADGSGSFKGFKGFSLSSAASGGGLTSTAFSGGSAPTAFSGFGNGGGGFSGLSALANGNSSSSLPAFSGFSSPAVTSSSSPGLTFNGPASSDIMLQQTNGSSPSSTQSSTNNKEYSRQLTALNCSVRDWITKHVNGNPLCDLNPIFKDYEQHLASIERQYGAGDEEKKKKPPTTTTTAPPAVAPSSSSSSLSSFSFGKTLTEDSSKSPGVTFNFGQKVDGSVLGSLGAKTTPPSFSFSSSSASSSSLFGSSSTAAPPSFKSGDARPPDENGEEESEEPPKPEIKEVKEDDAFYSKKCKLFYKKDSEFKEKGVGTLHLKQTEGKVQMIIRADTNLGTNIHKLHRPGYKCTQTTPTWVQMYTKYTDLGTNVHRPGYKCTQTTPTWVQMYTNYTDLGTNVH
ncbi:nuclear pore complex protein Nup50 isoform X2 [Anarrhichthys ocellatus]|uniref:nuclear pore complex protein Nup50 isoform X2 n=1 Tax=Anarrhichthys ocellatus TaxID=433405 RepID=UPI0012EDA518|nr:nuclear pore complex protein Nup50 isoform X2 [Anarrhichthys ocellatus]